MNVLIMANPNVEWIDADTFNVAVTFGDIPLICLPAIPKQAFDYVEQKIEKVIEHETLHAILARWECDQLDNIDDLEHNYVLGE